MSETPELTTDQVSGKVFVRFNLIALLVGLVALAAGAYVVSKTPPATQQTSPMGEKK